MKLNELDDLFPKICTCMCIIENIYFETTLKFPSCRRELLLNGALIRLLFCEPGFSGMECLLAK